MMAWFRMLGYSLSAAQAHIRRAPASFFLNMIVLSLTLSLPFAGVTLLDNLRPVAAQLQTDAEISVFMKVSTVRETAKSMEPAIRNAFAEQELVVRIEFVPRETALESLKSKAGLSDVIATLGTNPLPDAYLIRLEQKHAPSSRMDTVVALLKKLPNVDRVQIDSAWVKRLEALTHLLRVMLFFAAVALGLVVVAVAFNTVRLQLMAHHDEIALMRLIGATDAFIQRPFHLTGLLLGLGAGAMALGMVALALLPLNMALAEFARQYASDWQLVPLGIEHSALLLAVSAALGWLGALLSARRRALLHD